MRVCVTAEVPSFQFPGANPKVEVFMKLAQVSHRKHHEDKESHELQGPMLCAHPIRALAPHVEPTKHTTDHERSSDTTHTG